MKDLFSILEKLREQVFSRDGQYRAQIIYLATTIDDYISQCIAWHFCSDPKKHLAFMSLLFSRGEIPFSKKIDILDFILEHEYPDLYKETKGLRKKLDKLRELRNWFAHSTLAMEVEHLKKANTGIYVTKLGRKGVKEVEFFSEEDLKIRTNEYADLMLRLMELSWEFERRAKGRTPRKLVEAWNFDEEDYEDLEG
jgi:hypothetical protein